MTIMDKINEKLKVAPPEVAAEVLALLEARVAERAAGPSPSEASESKVTFDDFRGLLRDSKVFAGDPVEIQRALRDEWDR